MNQFNYEQELGNYLVASDLLQNSWAAIFELYKQKPQTHHNLPHSVTYKRFNSQTDVTVIAFVCSPICNIQNLQGEGRELVSSETLLETFSFLLFDSSYSVHKAAANLYQSLHAQLVQEKIDIAKPLVITGHALGGSVASLFTLWLLKTCYSEMDRNTKRPVCITFGSPLLGDDGLHKVLSGRPSWISCFVHVVSKQDWFTIVSEPSFEASSHYKPFGLYLFCSETGVACFSEPEFVLELLGAFGSKNMQLTDYGLVLECLKDKAIVKDRWYLGGWKNNPLRISIIMKLQAIGIHEMQKNNELIRRIEGKLESLEHEHYGLDLEEKLKNMKINMAHLEWYKKTTRSLGGYYDSYKSSSRSRGESLSKVKIVKHQESLKKFWKKFVAEAKRTDGKSFSNLCLLMAANNYRRMVEPLDIAEYYKDSKQGQKDYWAQGRSEHYILLEKWLEVAEPSSSRPRKKACSFNEDSCFWAYVEEALILLKLLKDKESCPVVNEDIFKKLGKFEDYVMESINKLMVDPEIFLAGSSFRTWWSIYSDTKGSSYHSPLANYMKNKSYRAYA